MCRCTPEIRTPYCGKPGCEWPENPNPEVSMPSENPEEPHFGYLYFLPDSGIEWSEEYPPESDAEDVRPATLKELHAALMTAWGCDDWEDGNV